MNAMNWQTAPKDSINLITMELLPAKLRQSYFMFINIAGQTDGGGG